jgi:hypothetical protein
MSFQTIFHVLGEKLRKKNKIKLDIIVKEFNLKRQLKVYKNIFKYIA